jgi:FKBP-type peptidyl-prolyl cis-trans isomerase
MALIKFLSRQKGRPFQFILGEVISAWVKELHRCVKEKYPI